MNTQRFLLVLLAALLMLHLGGCDQGTPDSSSTSHSHNHDHDHDHGHNHDHDHDHRGSSDASVHGVAGHSGPRFELGEQSIGPFTVKAVQLGSVAAGEEAAFELFVVNAPTPPRVVRAWIGGSDGVGSLKTVAELMPAFYDAHVQSPATLTDTAQLWVELETNEGQRHTGGFGLHR